MLLLILWKFILVAHAEIDSVKNINILGQNLKAPARSTNLKDFTSQQDNDSKHAFEVEKIYIGKIIKYITIVLKMLD